MSQIEFTLLEEKPFQVRNDDDFEQLAIEVFNFQYKHVSVYNRYCDLLKIKPNEILRAKDIPFLPISAFKHHRVLVDGHKETISFKSSGTSKTLNRSSHFVSNSNIYERSLNTSFNHFIGKPVDYTFYSLLPGYEENKESSLIYMLNILSKQSTDGLTHRFQNKEALIDALVESNSRGDKSILVGVSFALIDLAMHFDVSLPLTSVIETGGMKGNRKEVTRNQLHHTILSKLKPASIISEYGMTEMLSQAYAVDSEYFKTSPWLKVFVRDVYDPLSIKTSGNGAINIIDLANINSCAFIASDDLGQLKENGDFSILGRFDHSEIRGCNLLYVD